MRFPLFNASTIALDLATDMPDATIHTKARVIAHVKGPLYRVSLPNGKVILAHLSKPLALANAEFHPDDTMRLELTPYDFDQARILGRMD